MKYLLKLIILGILSLISTVAAQSYPFAVSYNSTSRVNGMSSRWDHLTGVYHVAWHDSASGSIQYRRMSADGNYIIDVTGTVDTSEVLSEPYAVTSVAFDENSRPVVAYTRLSASTLSIHVARWNGSAWIHSLVASGFYCTTLSLDLYMSSAFNWRLAYVNDGNGKLHLASAGGGNHEAATLSASSLDNSVLLHYSANSGSLAWRDGATQALMYGNPADDGSGITGLGAQEQIDAIGNPGGQISRAPNAPGGWPHFVHRDVTSGEIRLTRRLPDFSWKSETIMKPNFPGTTLTHPQLWFDDQQNMMVASNSPESSEIRYKINLAGQWMGDRILLDDYLLNKPFFISNLGGGGFRIHAVARQFSNVTKDAVLNIGPIDDFVDADGDAVPLRFERAFKMNPTLQDRQHLPKPALAVVAGQNRLTLTVRHDAVGTQLGTYGYESGDYRMLVEASPDLQTWTAQSSNLGIADNLTISGVRFITYYLQDPVGTVDGLRFLRVRVDRQ